MNRLTAITLASISLCARHVCADETIYVIDAAPDHAARDRDRALADAPFVTIVHPDEHATTASVAEALATTAGVQGQSLGGLGAYQTISVRGAAPGHTAVLIDGVPLARLAAVTTDLGRFTLDSFGEVELYRGAVPVELGGAGIGGAVNMVTRLGRGPHGERFSFSAGMGSYGARHVRAHYGDETTTIASATTIGYQGATGDFTFFDDNGTLLNTNDDAYRTRTNNGFEQVDATTRISGRTRPIVGGVRFAYKQQGLPGAKSAPTLSAKLDTADVIADAQGDVAVGRAVARQLGYVLVERQRLHDPDAELGFGTSERSYTTLSAGASSTWKAPLGAHRWAAGIELRGDRFTDRDEHMEGPTQRGTRFGAAAAASLDLALTRDLVVTPAVRLDLMRTRPTPMTAGPDANIAIDPRWDTLPSPRLSARATLTDDLALKGSAGSYARIPTLIEVFGNRGFIVGSPGLRPETGTASDLGLVWAPAKPLGVLDRVFVQGSAFASRAHDTIAFITTAGYVARAVNLEDSQAYGAEIVAAGRIAELVSVTASYTRLATAQLSSDVNLRDHPIPRRPGHLAYGRIDITKRLFGRDASVWSDASYQAKSTLDRTALLTVPQRVLLGLGARLEIGAGLALAGSIANLANDRVSYLPLDPAPSPTFTEAPTPLSDVTGFPLPGRSFYLSVDWTH